VVDSDGELQVIIPEPKDLPGNAIAEARKLTNSIQSMNANVAQTYDDIRFKIQQGNISLQALTEQVGVLASYIGTLPAASAVVNASNVGFSVSNAVYTTMASLSVTVPAGFTQTSLFIVANGTIVDTIAPYSTVTYTRLVVNGIATQPITTNYVYYGTPPTDMFFITEARVVNGTTSIPVEVQAIADEATSGDGNTYARIQVFAIFNQ
jgi:hypothetical protein